MITIDDFRKLEIKMAKILSAEDHPNADKLLVLKVDIGGEERQLVAGIKTSYEKEDLPGKLIAVLTNLEPAIIRGVESQGMLLAAKDDAGISVLMPDRDVKHGSIIS